MQSWRKTLEKVLEILKSCEKTKLSPITLINCVFSKHHNSQATWEPAIYEIYILHPLLFKNQSAYRPYHSCKTALLNISDKWLKAMDDSELVGTVFLDLSKAFDL